MPRPWEYVTEAAARHDDGMDDYDAEPELDPETGLPRSFMRMPLDLWLESWRQGPSIVAEDSPYAGHPRLAARLRAARAAAARGPT